MKCISVGFESRLLSLSEISERVRRCPTFTSPKGKVLQNGRVRDTALWSVTWEISGLQEELVSTIDWLQELEFKDFDKTTLTLLVSDVVDLSGEVFPFAIVNRILQLGVSFDIDDCLVSL